MLKKTGKGSGKIPGLVLWSGAVAFAIAVVLIILLARALSTSSVKRPLRADFLDVGQGDAILLTSGSDQVLIDGGPDRTVLHGLGGAMPLWDRRIEHVVVTHAHRDHVVGIIHVIKKYSVGRVYFAPQDSSDIDDAEWEELKVMALARGVPMTEIAAGDSIALGAAHVDFLWPANGGARRSANDNSIVSRVTCGEPVQVAALLMGDVSSEVEKKIVDDDIDISALVLKVGHHGSRYSTSKILLDEVKPFATVISVGKNNYGHPAWVTSERLIASGAENLRTDQEGNIRLVFSEDCTSYHRSRFANWPVGF